MIYIALIIGLVLFGLGLWGMRSETKKIKMLFDQSSQGFSGHPGIDAALAQNKQDHILFRNDVIELQNIMRSLLASLEEINRQSNPYR